MKSKKWIVRVDEYADAEEFDLGEDGAEEWIGSTEYQYDTKAEAERAAQHFRDLGDEAEVSDEPQEVDVFEPLPEPAVQPSPEPTIQIRRPTRRR